MVVEVAKPFPVERDLNCLDNVDQKALHPRVKEVCLAFFCRPLSEEE